MAKKTAANYTYAVGRRRSASARVRLFKGKGENLVNDMSFDLYFPGRVNTSKWTKPLRLTETLESHYVTARVAGGGKHGQLEAVTHGIAKALNNLDVEKYRAVLKSAGLLTRDARVRERRKVNTGGKARRQKQSPKR